MLDELQSLAAIASSQPDIVVQRGESGCQWSFNWKTQTITANPEDLDLRPPDYCRGLILHESAHAAITRLAEIVPDEWKRRIHPLLNVIEDCRIETWLQQRFPGSAPWIRLYNDRLFGKSSDATSSRVASDPAAAFLSGMLDRWWNESPVLTLHPEAAAALDRIWPHFQPAAAAFPPPRAEVPESVIRSYPAHPVSLCFQAQDHHNPPTRAECEIRMCQHLMWSITWAHIVPEFLRLLRHPGSEPTRIEIEAMQCPGALTDGHASHTAARRSASGSRPGTTAGVFQTANPSAYATALARRGAVIESCGEVLLRFLTSESKPRTTRFHRSGQRLDLRVAMQFEADPRQHERLWLRTSLPFHPDPAFVVAVDASGSMRGSKAAATFESLVIIRETCLRLGIPLAIIAFNTRANIFQTLENPGDPAIEARLAGLLKPTGGTDIVNALKLASRILTHCPNRHRHLWILSDGDSNNPDQARRMLRGIRADGTRIHGLGLGDESGEIAKLIPGSPFNLQPHELPATFTALLQGNIIPLPS